jgi:hypothetical protein
MAQSNQKQKSPTSDNSAFGRGIATVASSAERVGSTKGKGRLDRPFGNQRCVRSVVAFAAGVADGYAALAPTGINTRISLRHASAIQRLGCGVMLGVVIGSTGATVIGCVPFHCSFSRRGRCWSSDFSSRHWSGRSGRERIGQKRRSPDQRQKSRGFFTGRPTFAGYFFRR